MALVACSGPGCKPKDDMVQDALSRNPLRFFDLPRCLEDAVYPVDWRHSIGGFFIERLPSVFFVPIGLIIYYSDIHMHARDRMAKAPTAPNPQD